MNNNEFGPDLVTNEKLLKENEALLVEIENYQEEVDKFDAMLKVIFCFCYSGHLFSRWSRRHGFLSSLAAVAAFDPAVSLVVTAALLSSAPSV